MWTVPAACDCRVIDYAPGIVILAGIVKIMPALLTNQMTGIFQWGI